MAIVFVGSELDSFEVSTGAVGSTNAASFATPYARGSVGLLSAWARARFPSLPTMWATWRHYTNVGAVGNLVLFETGGPQGAIARVFSGANGTNGSVQRWDGAAWVDIAAINVSDASFMGLGPQTMAVKIDPVNGFIRFWRAGELVAEFIGNTATRAGMTGCNYFQFNHRSTISSAYISEVIIGDTDNRLYRLATLAATGNGANTAWVNDVAAVNALTSPESTYISSGTAGEKESFVMGNLPAATADSGEVKAVAVAARHVIQSASGPQTINGLVRVGTTDYTKALSPQNKDASAGGTAVWDTSPATGQKWTRAEVDALEAGVQSAA
ncbi:hypothetical protein GOC60_17015 [Sinorhizobium meliloti]|nr:hypothetical protein [Sinorhizobium meliloti]MDX0350165.1 hypothetical protein [Sinorhizobium meliloti]